MKNFHFKSYQKPLYTPNCPLDTFYNNKSNHLFWQDNQNPTPPCNQQKDHPLFITLQDYLENQESVA